MIEPLTADKLKEYGFDNEAITLLLTWDNYPYSLQNNEGSIWACSKEKKIYSGIDALRKRYFSGGNNLSFPYDDLNLVPEYYELGLSKYLKEQKELAGIIFVEKASIEKFRLEQIDQCNNVIAHYSNLLKGRSFQNIIKKTKAYLDWLNQADNRVLSEKQPQQVNSQEEVTTPVNKYPRIFVNGWAYDLFEKLRAEIISDAKQQYSDYSFIFQRMINDEYLIQTKHVKLIEFIDKEYLTTIGLKYNQFNKSTSLIKNKAYSRYNKELKSKIKSLL
ncbi:MAG: hypothetical protein HYX39_07275 [Bacteroidetes bacterium]|nr:hypothetical protein [Bacteroidota bacterium]